jgi:hypothetical protein
VKIIHCANLPKQQKSKQFTEAEKQIKLAKQERELYNEECIKSKQELMSNNPLYPTSVHFSFDFLFFGVCCEAKSEQVNYLIDENDIVGSSDASLLRGSYIIRPRCTIAC